MTAVKIGKLVDYETLETALIEAAEEVGWKADVQDTFRKSYELGSVQEVKTHDYTQISLKGRLFPAMKVIIDDKYPTDRFDIRTGLPHGVASESKVHAYLWEVSRNLQT